MGELKPITEDDIGMQKSEPQLDPEIEGLITEIEQHPEKSGILSQYLDWDYIRKSSPEQVRKISMQIGQAACSTNTLGQAVYFIMDGLVRYQRLDMDGKTIFENTNRPYEYFGEQAVINGKTSLSRNIVESETATLLSVDASIIRQALESGKGELDIGKIAGELEIRLPEALLQDLITQSRLTIIRPLESLVTQNTDSGKIRILLSGRAFVLHDSKRGPQVQAGSVLGDCEFFDHSKNIASIITETECAVLEIDYDKFAELLENNIPAKQQFSDSASHKKSDRNLERPIPEPYGKMEYKFSMLANDEETNEKERMILTTARKIISEIADNCPEANHSELDRLFAYICASLEYQEQDDPKYFVSHGAQHTINVDRFAASVIDGSQTLKKNLEDIFGSKGKVLLRLAAIFHDIGYPEINNNLNAKKWEHQVYSGKMIASALSYDNLNKIVPLSREEYELFVEAISHHGSDNPDAKKLAEGRPFVFTEASKNPLLATLRIADNLDLISERLSKLQRDLDFRSIIRGIYYECSRYTEDDQREKRKELMGKITTREIDRLRQQSDGSQDEEDRLREIERNLAIIIEMDDYRAHLHFESVAITQNVFVNEEPTSTSGQTKLTIGIEYSEPSEQLPLNLINWQAGRLEDSYEKSLDITNESGMKVPLRIKKIFPFKGGAMNEIRPGIEHEELKIPEFELSQWLEEMSTRVEKVLEEKARAIVNLSGASASGKGEATKALADRLSAEGKRVLVMSTDDFYKGISRMISEKLSVKFPDHDFDFQTFSGEMKEVTGDKAYSDKMSPNCLFELKQRLGASMPSEQATAVLEAVQEEFAALDFDNPSAVDLDRVNQALASIANGESVSIPTYSMQVSEAVGSTEINPDDYDVVLLEGIYGLNEKVTENADIKSFVESDIKTLLMRRMRRDVVGKRVSFPPDVSLWITLELVLPAYQDHIKPDKSHADLVLKNEFTANETFDTQSYDVQDKVKLNGEDLERIASRLGEPMATISQRDLYFVNNEDDNLDHLIRLRVENGRLKSLVHKGSRVDRSDGKVIRPTETYINDGEFGVKYNTEEEMLEAFSKAGFILVADINKLRKNYAIGEVEITLDEVDGLGAYAEFRTNDKLSKSPEIDRILSEFELGERKPVGPYADEYVQLLQTDSELAREQEIILNRNLSREAVLSRSLCEVIEPDEAVQGSFAELRRGYPELPLAGQSSGGKFRQAASTILERVAQKTLEAIDTQHVVIILPWRSGIAFAKAFEGNGVNNFYHLSSKRDEETLETVVDFEEGNINSESTVIIADPMLATGNTIVDAVERCLAAGVAPENIWVNSVVAAPAGVESVKRKYPEVKVVTGSLDEKLDHKGYIVPGLGDFGDKYFAGLSGDELNEMIAGLHLSDEGRDRLIDRIRKQGASEVLSEIVERDFRDMEIDKSNKELLIGAGLMVQKPGKILKIDTGRISGIENVVQIIENELGDESRIITIEGSSGTGKSSTTKALREKIGASVFSMGEIFRYLALYSRDHNGETASAFESMHYEVVEGTPVLMDGETRVDSFNAQLRSQEIETLTPSIAAKNQQSVIEFVLKQLEGLRDKNVKIIIEGRGYTLDFLTSDIRVKLVADPSVRAERRWNQRNG